MFYLPCLCFARELGFKVLVLWFSDLACTGSLGGLLKIQTEFVYDHSCCWFRIAQESQCSRVEETFRLCSYSSILSEASGDGEASKTFIYIIVPFETKN